MATKYLLLLTFLQIFNSIKADLGATITLTNCTVEDFKASACDAKCELNLLGDPNSYNVLGQWLYSGDEDLSENVTIFDGSSYSNSSADNFTCSLHLTNNAKFTSTNYYAGYYSCFYKIKDSNGISYEQTSTPFQIDDSVIGKYINESCSTASECLALDAQCPSSKQCECVNLYDISFSTEITSIACLSSSKENEPCNIDNQCNGKPLEKLYCIEQTCLPGVPLMEVCTYDKSCNSSVENSHCNNGICNCIDSASVSNDLKKCEESTVTIKTTTCGPSDYQCQLSCTATAPNANYKLVDFYWRYKSFQNSTFGTNVTITEGVSNSTAGNAYTALLSYETYNSGYYFCQFTFLNDYNVTIEADAVFQITPTYGVLMNETCTASQDCATLNAVCTNDTHLCACLGKYSIEYNLNSDSPACLEKEGENGGCNLQAQCIQAEQSFDCVDYTCTCTGTKTYISETKTTLCIAPAYYGLGCRYNEQCALSNPNTACNNLFCGCKEDFEYSDSTFQCEKTLSGGAIAGIVIGCLVGVAAIVVLIICIIRK